MAKPGWLCYNKQRKDTMAFPHKENSAGERDVHRDICLFVLVPASGKNSQ